MKVKLFPILKTVIPLLLGIYLIWYFFHSMSEESLTYFYKALHEANYFWIILALLLSFCAYLSRAYRWKYTLEPMGFKTPFWNRYHAMMIGYLINLTIPRAGEASRAAMLYRSDGVPFSKSFGTIIAERIVDLFMLFLVTLITLALAYDDFFTIFKQIQTNFSDKTASDEGQIIKYVFYVFLALGFIIFTYFILFKKKVREKIILFVKGLFDGLFSIFKSKNPFLFFSHTLLIWILYIVYFGIAFFSLEETKNFPLDGMLVAFIAGALGISLTNGGMGTFPLLVALVVVFYLEKDNANALAIGNALGMLIWVSQTILLIVLGLISFLLLPKNFSKKSNEEHV
ncbi:MAG: lysylphosphatidylglycerol synthase transmembrane domain-containing protein [Bacteroidota bacterium]